LVVLSKYQHNRSCLRRRQTLCRGPPTYPAALFERHDVENGYANLAFPFTRIGTPAFIMTAQWDLQRLLGYFRSWSATARMEKATGGNPIDGYAPVLQSLWGDPGQRRALTWPLMVRAGKVAS
jgi:hypothetical protein